MQKARLLQGLACSAIGETFALGVGLGELVFVVPAALVNKMVHVGTVGTVAVSKDTQCSCLQVAAVLGHVGQAMTTHKVLVGGLIGACRKKSGLSQHANL